VSDVVAHAQTAFPPRHGARVLAEQLLEARQIEWLLARRGRFGLGGGELGVIPGFQPAEQLIERHRAVMIASESG